MAVQLAHADHTAGHDHAHGHDHGHGHDDNFAHVMPIWILIGVFLALIALTVVTVYSSYFPLGEFELVVAMGIATVKALMVILYFMHVRYDKPINGLLVLFSLAFVALFIGFTLVDSLSYQPEIEAETISKAP